MGRKKQAPEPLSLPPSFTTTSVTPATVTTSASTSTSASASASASISVSAPATNDGSALFANLETVSSASTSGLSPANSRSPASTSAPNTRASPFSSRFSQKRPQTAKAGQQPRSADTETFDQRLLSESPHFDDGAAPKTATATTTTTTYPHIATAYNHTSTSASSSPRTAQQQPESKKSKSGFFHFNKPSKTVNQFSNHVHQYSGSSRDDTQQGGSEGQGPSSVRQGELPRSGTLQDYQKTLKLRTSRSELSLSSSADHEPSSASTLTKKNKGKPFGRLTRTKSLRDREREMATSSEAPAPMPAMAPPTNMERDSPPPKTASYAQPDRAFREMMDSSVRNRSEDREQTRERATSRDNQREPKEQHRGLPPSTTRENGGSTFFSGLKNSSTKAAGMFGRSLFGKGHRSASTYDHQPSMDDEHYEIKVLNLPLAAQTRKTRISKRLEDSRDKTEFWMPAFPWRAIDYLNYKGCEVEGLYRVPGSGPQIKKWQRKFDEQYDVNLFEQEDLYDINIIGSMLKAWLRELPDELFPKASQERIARECAGAETVPQMLVDELSNLSPFQYYLLFAITCHLSLLLAHSDKNKMDFRNLCICFQPCMKIDAFCFRFLVCDWRDCWKGCKNEAAYIEQEYILLDQPPPRGLTEAQEPAREQQQQQQQQQQTPRQLRTPSPDNGSNHSDQSFRSADEHQGTSKQANLPKSESKDSTDSYDSTISTTLTINSVREHTKTGDLRRLSPIQPLSPLGFQ